jgi:hypothetical protein
MYFYAYPLEKKLVRGGGVEEESQHEDGVVVRLEKERAIRGGDI